MRMCLHIKYEYEGKTYTIKKSYLRLASVYRRFAGKKENLDFSPKALLDCYLNESRGIPIKKYYGGESYKNNGYIIGKWNKDITVTTWKEDIVAGYFCKDEFINGIDKWWVEPALTGLGLHTWFPYEKQYHKEIINKIKSNAIKESFNNNRNN